MPHPQMYNTLRSRKNPRKEDCEEDGFSALGTGQEWSTAVGAPETPRQEPRNVSFSRKHMLGVKPRPPGHRTSASPSRPALRGASSSRFLSDDEHHNSKRPRLHASLAPWRTPEASPSKRLTIENYNGRSFYHDLLLHTRMTLPQPLQAADDNALGDVICQRAHVLTQRVIHFATHFRPLDAKYRDHTLHEALISSLDNAQTVRYVGYLASATQNGLEGWDHLLESTQSLQSLVVAMISQALRRYVFGASWFGGANDVLDDNNSQEIDAFWRNSQRATRCQEHNKQTGTTATKALADLEQAEETLAAKILFLVLPLYELGRSDNRRVHLATLLYPRVLELVVYASTLSRQIRMVPNAVYEWTAAFKGTKFDAKHMEAVNIGMMLQSSPYVTDGDSGHARLRNGAAVDQSQPLVLISAFPGLVAYRRRAHKVPAEFRGDRHLQGESTEFELTVRVLTKRGVFLYWGKQQETARLAGPGTCAGHAEQSVRGEQEGSVELFNAFVHLHGSAALKGV